MPAGRPSVYTSEFCERVIEYGSAGKSLTWIAAEIGVSRETIYRWMEEIPEFSDAMTEAQLRSQQWWEDAGQRGMEQTGFNAAIWSRSMAARFPKDWRENKGVELSGGVKVETATKEQRDAATAAVLRADG